MSGRRLIAGLSAVGLALLAAGCDRAAQPAAQASEAAVSGAELYGIHCVACHMEDGSGVPGMQPALAGNAIVTGDRTRLVAVVREGSAALGDRESGYALEMPAFDHLSAAEIEALATYVRARFGPAAP